jgi:hypothetical protein
VARSLRSSEQIICLRSVKAAKAERVSLDFEGLRMLGAIIEDFKNSTGRVKQRCGNNE